MKWLLTSILALNLGLTGCTPQEDLSKQPDTDLIIYSGITMVRPLSVLVKEFEQQHNVNIAIKQGASGYLYKTLKEEQKGDIFFPGSDSYRKKHHSDGILKDYKLVGFNRIALVIAKGNPKKLTNELNQLKDPNLSVVLSSPESGAVGKNAKLLLDKANITREVFDNTTYFTTDSHRIFNAIKKGHADIALNWYATTKWPETVDYMDAILLPNEIAKPKRLELNLLSFSQNPELALKFMEFAGSEHGLQTFAEFGFFTEQELKETLSHIASPKQEAYR